MNFITEELLIYFKILPLCYSSVTIVLYSYRRTILTEIYTCYVPNSVSIQYSDRNSSHFVSLTEIRTGT